MDIPDFSFLPINSTTALTIGVPVLFFLCLLYLQAAKDKTSSLYLVCKVITQFIWYDIICNIIPGLKKYNKEFHQTKDTQNDVQTLVLPLDLSSNAKITDTFNNHDIITDLQQALIRGDSEVIAFIKSLSPDIKSVVIERKENLQKILIVIELNHQITKQIILDTYLSELFKKDKISNITIQ